MHRRLEKIRSQSADLLGAPVHRVAIVWPPVPVSRQHSDVHANSPGVWLKRGEALTGMAALFDGRRNGLLARTDTELAYLHTKWTGRPTVRWASWPIGSVSMRSVPKRAMGYAGLLLTFSDGSQITLEGEQRWGLAAFID